MDETNFNEINRLKIQTINHRVFKYIRDINSLRIFMEAHIFAVWDFMSLAKRLQRELSCVSLPWIPPEDSGACRLINEIMLGEECDDNIHGGSISHYEMYIEAMKEVGCDTSSICGFMALLKSGSDVKSALEASQVPSYIKQFVWNTISTAQNGSLLEVLGYFFYGREDIIPNMFSSLLNEWGIHQDNVPMMSYYLKRHIELDANEHGPAVERIIDKVISHKPEEKAFLLNAAKKSMKYRTLLFDGIYKQISETENALYG